MPKQKWNLTRAEQKQNRNLENRLIAAGALDSSRSERADPEWIQIRLCPATSYVRAAPFRSIFAIHARIVALATNVIIQHFEVSSSVEDLDIFLDSDPMVNRSERKFYRCWDGLQFHRDEVLNHRVDEEGVLRRGDVMEGVVLAASFKGVPSCFGVRYRLPLALSIVNQFDDVQHSTLELPVERISLPLRLRPSSAKKLEPQDLRGGEPITALRTAEEERPSPKKFERL